LKKYLPYILIALVLAAVITLFITGNNEPEKKFDGRVTFRKRDKIPYGLYVAYSNLAYMFPGAAINTERNEPENWDSLDINSSHQALIIISPTFNADEREMKDLVRFIENGNDVFISTLRASYYAEKFIKCDIFYPAGMDNAFFNSTPDSLTVSLAREFDARPTSFTYPGRSDDFWFYNIDSATSTILGYNKMGKPDFIRLSAGKGHLFLHLAPMAFSNYFLLHKDNLVYYEKIMSALSPNTERVGWDEYYTSRQEDQPTDESSSNWLTMLLQNKALRWGILTALLTLLVYVLVEMRRKQRFIPVVTKPKNDSMEFVKTIGRLYYDKGDHRNLSKKMAAYFLDHVRNRYKLSTTKLDEEFRKNLHAKTGAPMEEIASIVNFIGHLEEPADISDKQLADFHKRLEKFYQHS
jgi:hypothetical protein